MAHAPQSTRRATVIGGAGFIGRHLVDRLRIDGWDCAVPGREVTSFADDLGHVFYCAGLTGDYAARPFDTVEAHVTVLSHVLQESDFSSLVYLSSTRLYDTSGVAEASESTPLVLDPQDPRHSYDLSKALGESLCIRTGGGRARVARLSSVYASAPDDGGGFLSEVVRMACDNSISGGHRLDTAESSARDYVSLDDVIDALMVIAVEGTQTIYNVASGTNVSNAELFEFVLRATGVHLGGNGSADMSAGPQVVISRMSDEFGWKPKQLMDRLPDLVEARRRHGDS